jgi:hypothetical protein
VASKFWMYEWDTRVPYTWSPFQFNPHTYWFINEDLVWEVSPVGWP